MKLIDKLGPKLRMFNEQVIYSNEFAVISKSDNGQCVWIENKDSKIVQIRSENTRYGLVDNFVFGIETLRKNRYAVGFIQSGYRVTELYVKGDTTNKLIGHADLNNKIDSTELEAVDGLKLPLEYIIKEGSLDKIDLSMESKLLHTNLVLYWSPNSACLINKDGKVLDISRYESTISRVAKNNMVLNTFCRLVLRRYCDSYDTYYDVGYTRSNCKRPPEYLNKREHPSIKQLLLSCDKDLSDITWVADSEMLMEALKNDHDYRNWIYECTSRGF